MGFNKATGDTVSATEFNSFVASAGLYAASAAGSDAYAITVSPVPNDYDAGDTYTFKADVANTGAATLNVNSLGAKTIKKFGTQDLATGDIIAGQMVTVKYDGTYFQIASEARPTPFMHQVIPHETTSSGNYSIGSSNDGSVLYLWDGGSVDKLFRYERDSLTGMYFQTHEVSVTAQLGDNGFIVQIGSYIYGFYDNGANAGCKRWLAADLTGETAMTMAATIGGNKFVGWTDGTYLYWISNSSATTARKWSISGTTFSAVSTATCDGALNNGGARYASMWDGTNAYVMQVNNGGNWGIWKLNAVDGSSITQTTKIYNQSGPDPKGAFLAQIDSSRMYIGEMIDVDSASTTSAQAIVLYPVTKP